MSVEMLDKSARFRIEKDNTTLGMAVIEDWKFIRVIQILGGRAEPIRKEGKSRLTVGADSPHDPTESKG